MDFSLKMSWVSHDETSKIHDFCQHDFMVIEAANLNQGTTQPERGFIFFFGTKKNVQTWRFINDLTNKVVIDLSILGS